MIWLHVLSVLSTLLLQATRVCNPPYSPVAPSVAHHKSHAINNLPRNRQRLFLFLFLSFSLLFFFFDLERNLHKVTPVPGEWKSDGRYQLLATKKASIFRRASASVWRSSLVRGWRLARARPNHSVDGEDWWSMLCTKHNLSHLQVWKKKKCLERLDESSRFGSLKNKETRNQFIAFSHFSHGDFDNTTSTSAQAMKHTRWVYNLRQKLVPTPRWGLLSIWGGLYGVYSVR